MPFQASGQPRVQVLAGTGHTDLQRGGELETRPGIKALRIFERNGCAPQHALPGLGKIKVSHKTERVMLAEGDTDTLLGERCVHTAHYSSRRRESLYHHLARLKGL